MPDSSRTNGIRKPAGCARGNRRSFGRAWGLVAGGCLLLIAPSTQASLWESTEWALNGSLGGALGYESNVYGIAGADGDTVFVGEPALSLSRKGSATLLRFDVGVELRNYLDLNDENTIDPSVGLTFAYPSGEESLTSHEASISWGRRSYPDLSVGDRLRTTEMESRWFGVLRDTGKTRVVGHASFGTQDYSRYGSDTLGYSAGLGLAWSPRDLFEYSVSYDYSYDEYNSKASSIDDSKRSGNGIQVAVRGEIMVNLEGSASIGVRHNKFSGAFGSSGWDWFASGDVSYTQTERRSWNIRAARATYYDAIGQAYNNTNLSVELRQGMAGGFTGRIRAGLGSYGYVEESIDRDDEFLRLGAGLDYDLTGRFSASLTADWYSKDSTFAFYDFNAYDLYARFYWRF